jgi:hypothetical protein
MKNWTEWWWQPSKAQLYSIKWLTFYSEETERAYWAVWNEYLPVQMHQIQWDRLLSNYFGLPCQCHSINAPHLVFVYILLLPEGQMGEARRPSKKQRSFRNLGAMHRKVPLLKQFSNQRRKMWCGTRAVPSREHNSAHVQYTVHNTIRRTCSTQYITQFGTRAVHNIYIYIYISQFGTRAVYNTVRHMYNTQYLTQFAFPSLKRSMVHSLNKV